MSFTSTVQRTAWRYCKNCGGHMESRHDPKTGKCKVLFGLKYGPGTPCPCPGFEAEP